MNRPIAIVLIVVAIAVMAASLLSLTGCASLGHGYQPPGENLWKAVE